MTYTVHTLLLLALASVGCASTPSNSAQAPDASTSPYDAAAEEALPTTSAEWGAFLARSGHRSWLCQSETHAAIPPSPHGRNRVCQNRLVTQNLAGTGQFPVGAALVKENYDDAGNFVAYFVETRTNTEAGGAGWYFYRRDAAGTETHNAQSVPFCLGCHTDAPRDLVFTSVR